MKHWKGATVGLAALLLLVTVLVVRSVAMRPAQGTVNNTDTAAYRPPATDDTNDLETGFIKLKYPKRYQVQTNQPTVADLLEYRLLVSPSNQDNRSSQIGISVRTLPAGGLTESTSYQLYASRPETYTLTNKKYVDDSGAIAVKKAETYEHTVLWQHGGYLLIITQTSATRTTTLDGELDALVASLEWLR